MAISTAVKNQANSRHPNPIGAYYPIANVDWGVLGGPVPVLAYNAGAGSLAMSTARCAISWITINGESTVSAEQTVSIAAGTGAFTITQPTVPVNGAVVLGWRVYSSSGGAGTPLLNVAALSTTQVQSSIATTQGSLLCFPVATTAIQVLIYGAGQAEPTVNQSGVQLPLPSVPANTTADVLVKVPQSFSTSRQTCYKIPNAVLETAGISLLSTTCVAPLWIASTAFSAQDFIVICNGLFQCTVAGTTSTAPNVPNFQAAVTAGTLGAAVTDNTATWAYRGRFRLVRMRWMNATGTAAIPVLNEYDLAQT